MNARYHAPAVAYDFARPRWVESALLLLWVVLVLTLVVWCLQFPVMWAQLAWAGLAVCASAWLLSTQWRQWAQGQLRWDGEGWQVHLKGSASQMLPRMHVRVGLDGGSWLWLEVWNVSAAKPFIAQRRVLWIFISQAHSPAQWGDLRRAVYSLSAPPAETG